MPFVIIVFSLCLLLMITIFSFGIPKFFGRKAPDTVISIHDVIQMSSDEIGRQLAKLIPEKREEQLSAMCYSMASPLPLSEYVCPKCGEKTMYSDSGNRGDPPWYPIQCRQLFISIKKSESYSLTLDESSFCSHCSPGANENKLKLIVTSDDGSRHITSPVSLDDLTMLKSFIDGGLTYDMDGRTGSLKTQIPRLQELLGDKIDSTLLSKLKD